MVNKGIVDIMDLYVELVLRDDDLDEFMRLNKDYIKKEVEFFFLNALHFDSYRILKHLINDYMDKDNVLEIMKKESDEITYSQYLKVKELL